MKKYKIFLIMLLLLAFIEIIFVKNFQIKNHIAEKISKQNKNSDNIEKQFNMESIEAFKDIFKIEEMNKDKENVYLCYNIEGDTKDCLKCLDYYINNGGKIEDINLKFLNENYVNGRIKISF